MRRGYGITFATFTTFSPTGFKKCRRGPLRPGPTFFASGASEGGKAGEGGVSEGGSGLATDFATSTGFSWPNLKKWRAPKGPDKSAAVSACWRWL